jgi:endonuclease
MESVTQLSRYLERIRLDPAMASCRGVLVAKWIKPQARVLAQAQGIDCVEIDMEVLRGNREPELKLFVA